MKVNIQQLHGKHIKIENTCALGRQTQIVSEPIPQVVFRDIADNILPDFTVKAVSDLWQDATCIHSLGLCVCVYICILDVNVAEMGILCSSIYVQSVFVWLL